MEHRQQPTRFSCGVACAAMLTDESVSAVMSRLPLVRESARRRKLKRAYVNVGELRRLIGVRPLALGRRRRGLPPEHDVAVLRIPNGRVTGWHWAVWSAGMVHDPMNEAPVPAAGYEPLGRAGVSHYAILVAQ